MVRLHVRLPRRHRQDRLVRSLAQGPGTNGKSVQIANRISLPTSYPATNYPMLSVYYPAAGNGSTQVVYDGVAFSSDYSALKNWQDTFTHSW